MAGGTEVYRDAEDAATVPEGDDLQVQTPTLDGVRTLNL